MGIRTALFCVGAALATSAWADSLPPDAAVDLAAPTMTVEPKVVVNSGKLEWVPFARDLSAWPTLSYDDKRPTARPRKVAMAEPLNGDPARGRDLAMRRDKGYCVICHQLPAEQWPGTVGLDLTHFKRHNYENAKVYQQIFDARVFNPNTTMPPFGTNRILNDQEIRDLVAFLQSIE